MDFNQKARGQKHHKNKARYKLKHRNQNNPSDTIPEPRKIINPIESSSSEDNEEVEDEEVEGNDFSLLAQAPISVGGHFQFKSDKNTENGYNFESLQEDNLFALDLNVLQYSLNCIPFIERCGLDKSYFTEQELENMKIRANMNKVQYESYLTILSNEPTKIQNSPVKVPRESNVSKEVPQQATVSKIENHATKDMLNHSFQQQSNEKPQASVEVDKAELEGWLDDILGD